MTATTRDPAATGAEEGEITGEDLKESGSYQDHFRIIDELGQGGYGLVYVVSDIYNNNLYALKLQRQIFGPSSEQRDFKIEIAVMREAIEKGKLQHLPMIVWQSRDQTRYAMEMLGPSISSMKEHMRKKRPEKPFTDVTVLRLAIHMLRCIRSLHEMGYIHRDIKPCNFLLTGDNENPVCLVDFGLCVENSQCKKGTNIGTQQYMSLNAIYNERQFFSDDIQSWFWSVLEMASDSDWKKSKSDTHLEFKQELKKEALRRELVEELQRELDRIVKTKLSNAFKKEEDPKEELLATWMKQMEMELKKLIQKETKEDVKTQPEKLEELTKKLQGLQKDLKDKLQKDLREKLEKILKGKMELEMRQNLEEELTAELNGGLRTAFIENLQRELKWRLRNELKQSVSREEYAKLTQELKENVPKVVERHVEGVIKKQEVVKTPPQETLSIFRRLLNRYEMWVDTDKPKYDEILGELEDELWRKHLCEGEPVYEWECMDNSELSELTWVPLKNGKSRRFV